MATKKVVRLHDATGPKPKRIMKKLKKLLFEKLFD